MHALRGILAAICLASHAAMASGGMPRVIEPFRLQDTRGVWRDSRDWRDARAVVVVFLGVDCPLARLYGPRLAELAAEYADKQVTFVAINANRQDSLTEIAAYVRESGLTFPLLKDPTQKVADAFGAQRTPEAFLLDAKRTVKYRGRIDDQHGVGVSRPRPKSRFLAQAIDQLLAGEQVLQPSVEPVGCFIGRARSQVTSNDITYVEHIGPLFQRHCGACHREGDIAPFSLTRYRDLEGWTDTIREVIQQGRMPPWSADGPAGVFANDNRMSDRDKKQLLDWIAHGAPEGNPTPTATSQPESDCGLGEPDETYRMPAPYSIPPQGDVPYQYFLVDPGFTEDRWVKAAIALPGNRAVVHHITAYYLPPGRNPRGPEAVLFNTLAAYAPGLSAAAYPAGTARRIPAGSRLVFQIHYTPRGIAEQDQSSLAIWFADASQIEQELQVVAAINDEFQIPPRNAHYAAKAEYRFRQDMRLFSLLPHMHLRGKAFRVEASFPDGRSELLLDVPRYDFNWQTEYVLAEPRRMPAGTELRCVGEFDNSAENLANPDPDAEVTWGDQTWQEMMVCTFAVSLDDQDLRLGPPEVASADDGAFVVRFQYRPAEAADRVCLAGSFNDWSATGEPMNGPDDKGRYWIERRLPAGEHAYKFVLDGTRWRADPGNRRRAGAAQHSVLELGAP